MKRILKTRVNYALVIRGNLEDIKKFQEVVEEDVTRDIQVVFQTLSVNPLWIKKGGEKNE